MYFTHSFRVILVLSVFFFNYPKFIARSKIPDALPDDRADTNKLIEDRPFEPVASVTEHSTDLLPRQRSPQSKF